MNDRFRNRFLLTAVLGCLAFSVSLTGQGNNTTASKDDWEEINFEYNSSVLVDGYPSLLRMAELLKKNPGYRVKLVGHGDDRGSEKSNQRLGAARAEAVKSFLTKYGADPNQITTSSDGKKSPKVSGHSAEARFINRRVNATVTDSSGKVIGDGGMNDVLSGMQKAQADALANAIAAAQKKQEECCSEILKRLDKLDEIATLLRGMKGENDSLRQELDALKKAQAATDASIRNLPKPLNASEVSDITERTADAAIKKNTMPRFALLGVNAGVDSNRNLTFTGRGRYFAPFKENFAIQAQGEYLYYRDRKEGQFDLGVVDRIKDMQIGLFTSFKNVQITDLKGGGTLGQGALTLDYLFGRGKVGVFGTKAFLDNALVHRQELTRTLSIETLLKTVDQVGAQATVGLYKDIYVEGNLGYLKSAANADRPGGTLRFVFPISPRWAFTLEGGMNETMLSRDNNGRVVAGFQFGNFLKPKEYKSAKHAIPVDVPRLRYELVTRRVRTGNDAPIVDAGPDQIGVPAGQITLDGSASYDPEGDPITFQWTLISGPSTSLSGANTAKMTFTSTEGSNYIFRLQVTDDKGAVGVGRVQVTTARTPQVRIARFVASPQQIKAGESSTLTWQTDGADSVTIDGIGNVAANGSSNVSPQQTTTYKITATNRGGSVSETTTVTVQRPEAGVIYFTASPMTIVTGQSTTLSWQTQNATTVDISGIGTVAQSGSQIVSPTADTTYTLTARNSIGQATAQVAIRVTAAPMARIQRFSAAPIEIVNGESTTLVWEVENATDVSITGVGAVAMTGTTTVTPTANTTYTLTAKNSSGEVTAQASVTVFPALKIVSFVASPAQSPGPGSNVVLSWNTEGATEVFIDGIGTVGSGGNVTVNPTVDTAYTLRAIGRRNTLTQTIQVTVKQTPVTGPVLVADAGPNQNTNLNEVYLDGSRSSSGEGLPITYSWRAVNRDPDSIIDANTVRPKIRFQPLAYGEYVFELTVTDSRGRTAKLTTRVFFTY